MEIERKFLIKHLPDLSGLEKHEITQGYLSTEPVVRVRRWDDRYILTYKSAGMMKRIEEEMPLTRESFEHLIKKADGTVISKTRYIIPEKDSLKIELDQFHGELEGLYLAEVEFPDENTAESYQGPSWFGEDMTWDGRFHNSAMSEMDSSQAAKLVEEFHLKG